MATLDDKLLGEKLHYYCSSSESDGERDEDDEAGSRNDTTAGASKAPRFIPEAEIPSDRPNTGPKGVIEDWRRYKQLERENRADSEREKVALAKRLALTCRTDKDDEAAKLKEQQADEDLEKLLDDDILHEYMEKRMREMMSAAASAQKHFGSLNSLPDADAFLEAIDKEAEKVVVLIGLYEPGVSGCDALVGCLELLAKEHAYAKFCKILASAAGLSKHFKASGVPALLVYKAGDLVTSFIKLAENLGDDFFVSDLESLLIEHGVLKSPDEVPGIIKRKIRSSARNDRRTDSDSD